jgi:hypothetical protein
MPGSLTFSVKVSNSAISSSVRSLLLDLLREKLVGNSFSLNQSVFCVLCSVFSVLSMCASDLCTEGAICTCLM